jgi:hypothetical protein
MRHYFGISRAAEVESGRIRRSSLARLTTIPIGINRSDTVSATDKVALLIMDVLCVHRLVENSRTQVRRGILAECRHELETKHGSKAEVNLHG